MNVIVRDVDELKINAWYFTWLVVLETCVMPSSMLCSDVGMWIYQHARLHNGLVPLTTHLSFVLLVTMLA